MIKCKFRRIKNVSFFSQCGANNLVTPQTRFLRIFLVFAHQQKKREMSACHVCRALPKKGTNRLWPSRRVGQGRQAGVSWRGRCRTLGAKGRLRELEMANVAHVCCCDRCHVEESREHLLTLSSFHHLLLLAARQTQ